MYFYTNYARYLFIQKSDLVTFQTPSLMPSSSFGAPPNLKCSAKISFTSANRVFVGGKTGADPRVEGRKGININIY